MKKRIATLIALAWALSLSAQSNNNISYKGVAPQRSEFISFSTRNAAAKDDRTHERYWLNIVHKLSSSTTNQDGERVNLYEVELPISWRDREVFLHTEGGAVEKRLRVNGMDVGECRDDRTPSEFRLTEYIKDGTTTIELISPAEADHRPAEMLGENTMDEVLFLYSQPTVRIHDILVDARPSENREHGVLTINVIVSSSRTQGENIAVGYDIDTPTHELKDYNVIDHRIAANATDTVTFESNIYGAMQYLWSAKTPHLYNLTVYLKRNGVISEFVNMKVGFGETSFRDGVVYRNGEPIEIHATRYNAAPTAKLTEADIKAMKQRNINTIYVDFPQPYWFYNICDRVGIYVVEQANINTDPKGGDRSRRGTLANNPSWLDEFLQRQSGSYYRVRNHPSIIAWSIGGGEARGYNMYKCYEWFKEREKERPVVYGSGEWNSDIKLPQPIE